MIISIINNKGGTGKTTTATNLAHALANYGMSSKAKPEHLEALGVTRGEKKEPLRILVVDQDAQSNTTKTLLGHSAADMNTLYSMFDGGLEPHECTYSTPYKGIFCIPNIPATATLEVDLLKDVDKAYKFLKEKVRPFAKENFDLTIIDCPPNLGLFVTQALACSDVVIVPVVSGSSYSIDGLVAAVDYIHLVKENGLNSDLSFLRLLINKVDLRNSLSKGAVEVIRRQFGEDMVFKTTITDCADFLKAENESKTCLRYAPQSTGTKKFKALAEELLEILAKENQLALNFVNEVEI